MTCTQAEIALILEELRDRIVSSCEGKMARECVNLITRLVNDLREYGRDYIRSKYGL